MGRYPVPQTPPRRAADGDRDGRLDHSIGLPRDAGNATDTPYWRAWREGWDSAEMEWREDAIRRL